MKILLGTLKDKGEDLAVFLEPRIGVKGDVSGGELDIEDKSIRKGVRSRHVKTYIKRFLSIEKVRHDYRVLVVGSELRLVELEGEEEEEEEKEKKKTQAKREEKPVEEDKGLPAPDEKAAAAPEAAEKAPA